MPFEGSAAYDGLRTQKTQSDLLLDWSSEQSPSKEFVNAQNLNHPSPPSPEKPKIDQRQLLFDKKGDSGVQE